MTNKMIAENLEKSYGKQSAKVKVLKGMNCQMNRGEIICILGPSGSGKSTFLNILGGIEKADGGSLNVFGRELTQLSKRELSLYRRNSLGFVFQFYNLIPNLTVRENIEVGAFLSKNPLDLDALIALLGLTEHEKKYPNQLSGGQQQRTSIGRAVIKNPELLICDEPTGALDYETAKAVLGLIQEINREQGTTILIATHNTAIAKMSHRILKLHDGKIAQVHLNQHPVDASSLEW